MQDAVVETLSVFLVAPGKACGESLAGFYSQLLEPLPMLWQLPIIGLATLLLVIMLLLVFGYEISAPLLTIRPAVKNRGWGTLGDVREMDTGSQTDFALINWQEMISVAVAQPKISQ